MKLARSRYTLNIMNIRFFAAVVPLVILVSCSRTEQQVPVRPVVPAAAADHVWYTFVNGEVVKTSAPQDAPVQAEKPWTEAVRISSASGAAGSANGTAPAYALVNRTGMLVFSGSTFTLYTDAVLFDGRSADNLVFENDTPVFSLYKSTFFNTAFKDGAARDTLHPFLAQFDTASHVSYPLISCENLGLGAESEVTDYIWDGNTFICSVKTEKNGKTDFQYLSVQPKIPLLSLTPVRAKQGLLLSHSDKETFRSLKTPAPFASAPERLKTLLSVIPAGTAFSVTCATAGGHSPRQYIRQQPSDDSLPLKAQAVIAPAYVCAVFSDGTTYISGALPGRHILRSGQTCAFRLPKLPAGYEYSAFAVSGTTMYAAWEETAFYKTGRSGFISVDLDMILYDGTGGD